MRPIQVTRRFPSNSWPMILVFLRVIYHSRNTSRLLTTIFSATMKQRRARRDESVPLERLVTTAWITIFFFWKLVAESRDTRRISIVLFSVPIVCRFYLEFATQSQLRHATFVFHPRRASPKEERLFHWNFLRRATLPIVLSSLQIFLVSRVPAISRNTYLY